VYESQLEVHRTIKSPNERHRTIKGQYQRQEGEIYGSYRNLEEFETDLCSRNPKKQKI